MMTDIFATELCRAILFSNISLKNQKTVKQVVFTSFNALHESLTCSASLESYVGVFTESVKFSINNSSAGNDFSSSEAAF